MKVSVFLGASVDGFIARPNGALDFLPTDGGEPHGYDEFMQTVDALVIGRKTYETVLTFPSWPYGSKRVVVLSSRAIHPPPDVTLVHMRGDPREILDTLAAQGVRHAYVNGGVTIQRFLQAGLVTSITLTRVPVLIGTGIPAFGVVPHDVHLRHVATSTYQSGLVKTEYEVVTRS